VGPYLWTYLSSADSSLKSQGTLTIAVNPYNSQQLEMRMFKEESIECLLESPAFINLFTAFSYAPIRAASDHERELFYYLIPFEIANEPLSVAQTEKITLLVHFYQKKGFWVELISEIQFKRKP
jgi:hypothetical protein